MNSDALDAEAEQGSGCKRQRADADEIASSSDDVAPLQILLDAIEQPGLQRLRAYAEMSGLRDLVTSDSLQAHTERILTSVTSSSTGCGGPVESIQAPPAIVQGLVWICQEMVRSTASREPVSARKKLMAFGWLLADVMGQVTPWHPEVALKVGKRLERSLDSVHTVLAEQRTTLAEALQAGDVGSASLAQAAMRNVLIVRTSSALVELELPADQAEMASASLALLAAHDRGEAPAAAEDETAHTAVLDAIPRLTQEQLWQLIERAQDELKARMLLKVR
jgi:hypothetical protein